MEGKINIKKSSLSTKVLVRGAFFAALSIILSRVFGIMITQTLKISFGGIPLKLSGLLYGPIVGGMVGFVSDIIGILINAGGAVHLGFTLVSVLSGVIPGLMYVLFLRDNKLDYKIVVVIACILTAAMSLFLNTIWLTQMYGTPYMALLVSRVPKTLIQLPVDIIITMFLYKPLTKI